jgi:hypothetical protein
LGNQATEARLPILASRDVVAVEEWREATIFETSYQFVGKTRQNPCANRR